MVWHLSSRLEGSIVLSFFESDSSPRRVPFCTVPIANNQPLLKHRTTECYKQCIHCKRTGVPFENRIKDLTLLKNVLSSCLLTHAHAGILVGKAEKRFGPAFRSLAVTAEFIPIHASLRYLLVTYFILIYLHSAQFQHNIYTTNIPKISGEVVSARSKRTSSDRDGYPFVAKFVRASR